MALAEKRICEHTDATTISSADEFIVDSMANGTRNITMTNLENQILSTDTYSALSGIGDGTITGSIADIDSNLNNLTYDSTTNRLTMTGNTAFSGTIDSSPTAGSGNAVSSGGTKTYVDSAVSQLSDEIDNLIKYTDISINASTSGHGTPTRSSAGAYYEPLATYAALGVTRDKILSINLIDWNGITKSFTPYLGSSTVSAMTDSEASIYAASGVSNVVMRVVYKN